MKLKKAQQLDKKYVFQSYRRTPILLERGKGVYVYDDEGKQYMDFLGGIAVNALGHCNPRVVRAIREQCGKLSHVSNLYFTEPMLLLAERLTKLSGMEKTFFANSGAEANEAAIKIVRRFHSEVLKDGRYEIICFVHAFHGRTIATLGATGSDVYKKGFEPLAPGFVHAEFNNLKSVEKLISKKTAAIMLEPVQGESGVYPATPQFMRGLASLRKKYGIQLIFDEVQCGLGRTGKWFAWQHYNVKPDVMTVAKPIGGGLPLGVMMARGKTAEAFVPGSHATTFGAGPVVCAAANAFLDEVEKNNLVAHAGEMGDYIMRRVADLRNNNPEIKEVRGKGLMIGVDIDAEAADAAAFFLRNGVLINAVRKNTIRILPPFIIGKKHADLFCDLLEKYLAGQRNTSCG